MIVTVVQRFSGLVDGLSALDAKTSQWTDLVCVDRLPLLPSASFLSHFPSLLNAIVLIESRDTAHATASGH